MNEEAVRKWLERYQQALYFITGRLCGAFDPNSIDGEPEEMIYKLKIKMQAVSELSSDIAKIIKEYDVGYVGHIVGNKTQEENCKAWMEFFLDRSEKG